MTLPEGTELLASGVTLPTASPNAFKINLASILVSPTTLGTWCPAGVALAAIPRGELIPLNVRVGVVPAVSMTDTVSERSFPTRLAGRLA